MEGTHSAEFRQGSEEPTRSRSFNTTRWTLVLNAGKSDVVGSQPALDELCQIYWYPLYAYVRKQGHSREDAEDLTQGFFARFLQGNYLEGLASEKGRFRAFLLAALKHFMANEWDRSSAQKRGGGISHLSLDWQNADERYQSELSGPPSPDQLYDRVWAITLLERVIDQLQEEHRKEGKEELFLALRPYLTVAGDGVPYPEVAEVLATTEGAVRVTVHRLRRRYRTLLRDEIAQTLSDPAQTEEEMRSLFAAFG